MNKRVYERTSILDQAHLVCDVERVRVSREPHVRLLLAVGADEGVDLVHVHLVHLLHCLFDLGLCGARVAQEHKGVIIFDLLHALLGVERVLEHAEAVHGLVGLDRLAGVLGGASELECFRLVERRRDDLFNSALERLLARVRGLDGHEEKKENLLSQSGRVQESHHWSSCIYKMIVG